MVLESAQVVEAATIAKALATLRGGFLPPPDAGLPDPPGEPAPVQTEWNIPSISEDTARDALVQYASSKCCYSTDPAEQLVFSNLEAHNTYRYRLETFTESRSTEWAHEAYRGQPVDAYTQPPPAPWVIPAKAPTMFKDATQEIKIPNTASVKKQCWVCNGSGVRAGDESCHHCKGTGHTNCDDCKGTGLNSCDTCKGKGQLLLYIKLKIKWIPSISEDFAKDAFIEYASSKCCYSSRPAKELVFTDLQAHNTYRYRLETFIESRKTEWDSVPYTGQVVDSYGSCVPAPWDIAVQVPAMFQNGKRAVQVPHTSSVKVEMYRRIITRVTQAASIYRQKGCTECSGSGSKTCHTCAGKGQLLFFINLIVEWKNHIYEFVPDKRSGFPVDRVSKVTGELLFTDTQYMVYPVVSFPDNAINQASQTAVREHQAQFVTTSRILQQRQTIELIPVTRVHYTWKEKTYIYFVYGAEHKVYTDDYPAKYKIYPPPSDRVPKPENDRNASVPHVRCATDAMGKVVSDAVNVMDGVRCSRCSGRGTKTCDICKGHRNLMHFIQNLVTWKNQIYEHVPDQCPGFPVKLFEKVNGDKFFVDESALVYPIVGFPEKEICDASKKGNDEHMARFSRSMHILQQVYPIVGFPEKEICDASKRGNDEHMARFSRSMHILQQRQTIELIPLTQAFYEYKEQEYNYFVYGIENKVHAPKYPSSCSIL
ncbi:UNVERIFIED_CONTAM: hypothetical protein FKN15_013749 [Acipenser sinensis]